MGLLDRLSRLDDRLGLSSTAAVERRLDNWPGARHRWENRPASERNDVAHGAVRGREPRDNEDISLWLSALEAAETSRLNLIIAGSAITVVVAFAVALGLEPGTSAIIIGVIATTSIAQAYHLRQFRNRRRALLLQHLQPDGQGDRMQE